MRTLRGDLSRLRRALTEFDPFGTLTGMVLMCIALGILVGFLLPVAPLILGWRP